MKRLITLIIGILAIALTLKIDISHAESFLIFATDEEFYEYITSMLDEDKVKNVNGLYANRITFNEYQVIAYGNQHGDRKKGEAPWVLPGYEHLIGKMLYRYLGYNYHGQTAENTHFTPDATSGRDPSDFNYVKVPNALKSWDGVDPSVVEHMLNSPLYGNGARPPFITLRDIGGLEYGKLVAPSTWKNPGSIFLMHRTN